MEDRELRNAAYKLIEGEMRVKLLEGLVKRNLGLCEVENFVSKERGKLRVGGGSKPKISFRRNCDKNDERKIEGCKGGVY